VPGAPRDGRERSTMERAGQGSGKLVIVARHAHTTFNHSRKGETIMSADVMTGRIEKRRHVSKPGLWVWFISSPY
jgi:hypothetical protein